MFYFAFYLHATAYNYAIAHICYRPSVCPSVCPSHGKRVEHTKTVEVRIVKFSPHGSPR